MTTEHDIIFCAEEPRAGRRIFDRELNAAILTLTDTYLPRGYECMPYDVLTADDLWTSCAEGRPKVFDRTGREPASIFGDIEVEHAFQALSSFFMYTPPVAHSVHRPQLCDAMIVGGFDRLMEVLVERYGDDARTQRWQKVLWTHTIGRLSFIMMLGTIVSPRESYDFVVKTLADIDPEGKLTVEEVRDGFVGMYVQAEQAREAIMGIMRAEAQKSVDADAVKQGMTFH